MRKIFPLTLLAALLPMATSAATITNEYIYHQYDPGEVRAMTEGQDFKVVVIGNPTVVPQAAFEARLMQMLQGNLRSLATHPTTMPVAANDWGYRLVLMFNTGSGETGRSLCGDVAKLPPLGGGAGELTVSAALCRGKDPLTVAFARTSAGSLDDPAAGQLFTELTSVLFPNRPGLMPNRNIPL